MPSGYQWEDNFRFSVIPKKKTPGEEEETVVTSSHTFVPGTPGFLEASLGSRILHGCLLWAVMHLGGAQYMPDKNDKGVPLWLVPSHSMCCLLQRFSQSCLWWLCLQMHSLKEFIPFCCETPAYEVSFRKRTVFMGGPLFHSSYKPDTGNLVQQIPFE